MGEKKEKTRPQDQSKVFGITVWPFTHLPGIFSLKEPQGKNSMRVNYAVRGTHHNLVHWINGLSRVVPFYLLTLICNYFYPIE